MSDQEKKAVANTIGGSVVMVEKTTDGRHKQPYRPTELEDDNEMYQKRSRAPVVPSVAEELKHIHEDSTNTNAENRERKECERAMSSEKHKHAKKFSSNIKRRESSPEGIAMTAIDVDKKRMLPPTQPIPPDVDTAVSEPQDLVEEKVTSKKPDEDSITEEIAELRTPEMDTKQSDWSDDEAAGGLPRTDSRSSRVSRMVRQFFCCGVAYEAPSEDNISDHRKKTPSPKPKREISWEDKEYRDNVVLKEMIARSEIWMLDRKASVGPCYRPGMPFEGPSGITICLPKKSFKAVNQPSGISINISRKSLVNDKKLEAEEQDVYECSFNKFLSSVKTKFGNLQSKIKNVLHV